MYNGHTYFNGWRRFGEGLLNHDDADVLMISYMIEAVRKGKRVIRIISDDTDVLILLFFWVRKLMITSLVQLEKWYGSVLHVNDIAAAPGDRPYKSSTPRNACSHRM